MSSKGKRWKVPNRKRPGSDKPIMRPMGDTFPPQKDFSMNAGFVNWPLAEVKAPPPPTVDAMRTAEAYVDPSRLITAQMFVPYNPSLLVTRKGLAVFDQMVLDEQVKAALAFKVQAAIAGGWEVVSPGGEEERWEVTTFVRDVFDHFPGGWDGALKKMMRALRYGYSVCEKVYDEPERGPLKGKLVLNRLVELKPHYLDFVTNASGKVEAIKQMPITGPGKNDGLFSPIKFVHYVYDGEFENAYGKSDLEAAYRPWWVKDNAYKWLAILLERYGIPPLFAMYNPNDYQAANLEELKKVVKNIQVASMGIIPRNSKEGLEFWSQNLAAGSHDLFIASLARFDADIAKALLQPSLIGFAQESGSQGAQSGGSLARSNTSWKSFMMVIAALQNDLASAAINSQIIPQLCDLNFPNLKSYPLFRFSRPDDEKELEIYTLWASLVSGKIVNRIEDDERHIRKSLGMPENDDPQLDELPGDMAAKAKEEAAKKGIDLDAKKPDAKPKKVPVEELSEEMRAFADENDAEWVLLEGHPVCFAADDIGGVWRTVNGRRVFIRDGESVDDALDRSLQGGGGGPNLTRDDVRKSVKKAGLLLSPKSRVPGLQITQIASGVVLRWEHGMKLNNERAEKGLEDARKVLEAQGLKVERSGVELVVKRLSEDAKDFAEWNPEDHPRQEAGTDKGGEFAPADAAAFEAVHAAFQPAKERIAKQYEERVTGLFEKMKGDLGPGLKNINNNWTWARTYNSTVRDNLKGIPDPESKRPLSGFDKLYSIDSDKLRTNGIRFADGAVRESAQKVLSKLGKVDSISASIDSGSNYFLATAMKGSRKVSIQQQMILNVSSRGTLFNQWPARINVDGKSVSEAKYKKGEYEQEDFAEWDESKHPRHPKGDDKSGEFAPSDGLISSDSIFSNPTTDEIPSFKRTLLRDGSGVTINVPLDQIIPTQETLKASSVQSLVDGRVSKNNKPPEVIAVPGKNKYILLDGHHRLAAEIKKGKFSALVVVIGSSRQ